MEGCVYNIYKREYSKQIYEFSGDKFNLTLRDFALRDPI